MEDLRKQITEDLRLKNKLERRLHNLNAFLVEMNDSEAKKSSEKNEQKEKRKVPPVRGTQKQAPVEESPKSPVIKGNEEESHLEKEVEEKEFDWKALKTSPLQGCQKVRSVRSTYVLRGVFPTSEKIDIPDYSPETRGQKLAFLHSTSSSFPNSLVICRTKCVSIVNFSIISKLISGEDAEDLSAEKVKTKLFGSDNVVDIPFDSVLDIPLAGPRAYSYPDRPNFVQPFQNDAYLLMSGVSALWLVSLNEVAVAAEQKGDRKETGVYFKMKFRGSVVNVDFFEYKKQQMLILVVCEGVTYLLTHNAKASDGRPPKVNLVHTFNSFAGAAFYKGRVLLAQNNHVHVLDSKLSISDSFTVPFDMWKIKSLKRLTQDLFLLVGACKSKVFEMDPRQIKTFVLDMCNKMIYPTTESLREKERFQFNEVNPFIMRQVFVNQFPGMEDAKVIVTSGGSFEVIRSRGLDLEFMELSGMSSHGFYYSTKKAAIKAGKGEGGKNLECCGYIVVPLGNESGQAGVEGICVKIVVGELEFSSLLKREIGSSEDVGEKEVEVKGESKEVEKEEEVKGESEAMKKEEEVKDGSEEVKKKGEEEEDYEVERNKFIIPKALLDLLPPHLQENSLLLATPLPDSDHPLSDEEIDEKESLILAHHRLLDAELLRYTTAIMARKMLFEKIIEKRNNFSNNVQAPPPPTTKDEQSGWRRDDGERFVPAVQVRNPFFIDRSPFVMNLGEDGKELEVVERASGANDPFVKEDNRINVCLTFRKLDYNGMRKYRWMEIKHSATFKQILDVACERWKLKRSEIQLSRKLNKMIPVNKANELQKTHDILVNNNNLPVPIVNESATIASQLLKDGDELVLCLSADNWRRYVRATKVESSKRHVVKKSPPVVKLRTKVRKKQRPSRKKPRGFQKREAKPNPFKWRIQHGDVEMEMEETPRRERTSSRRPPRRPLSAFFFFCGDVRPTLENLPEYQRSTREGRKVLDVAKIGRKLGLLWKNLSEIQKRPYIQRADIAKERYRVAKREWDAENEKEITLRVKIMEHDKGGVGESVLAPNWQGIFVTAKFSAKTVVSTIIESLKKEIEGGLLSIAPSSVPGLQVSVLGASLHRGIDPELNNSLTPGFSLEQLNVKTGDVLSLLVAFAPGADEQKQ